MKNKTPVMNEGIQTKVPDWLYQEIQEDDFLLGKIPSEPRDIWEDEE